MFVYSNNIMCHNQWSNNGRGGKGDPPLKCITCCVNSTPKFRSKYAFGHNGINMFGIEFGMGTG